MKKFYLVHRSFSVGGLILASIFFCAANFLLFNAANAQSFQWAKAMGSTGADYGYSIALDGSGNVYTTGYFTGTVDFDPGAGTFNLTSSGLQDIFVSKLDASGNLIWAKAMGGTGYDRGYSIAVDGSGNVYTTGYFNGTSDFDPGAGTFNLISAGTEDIFVSKLDASGNFIWAKKMGGTVNDIGYSIAVDGSGKVYTTGQFYSTADFDPGAGTFNLTSAGGSDIFVNKLDSSGNFIWAKAMGSTGNDYGYSIAVDGSGKVYTTGSFGGTSDFDPGVGTFNLTVAGFTDIFVSKLDSSGNFIWAKAMGGGAGNDEGYSITVNGIGNVYTTGSFGGTNDFDPGAGTFNLTSAGSVDIFVSKLDSSGNFIWAKAMGSTDSDNGNSISVDGSGNVYTTGQFFGTADFDPGAGTFNLTSAGNYEIFVSKLDSSGNFILAKAMGGAVNDIGYSIAVDGIGNVYTTGYFSGTSDFDPGAGTFNLSSAGDFDIFIAKYAPCNLTATALSNSPICNGSTATLSVSASGGTTPYSYLWSNGATASSITVSPSATTNYLVTVNDAGGCSATDSVLITVNASPTPTITTNAVSCYGGNNGSATASGGVNYLWSTSATTQTIINLAAGNYTVTVTNAIGCTATATATITQPAVLSATISKTDVSCSGGANGSATASASGGTVPYNYLWSNGQTAPTATGLSAGTYSVTVTDANGCTKTGSAIVNQPAALTSSVASTNVSCNGGSNGTAAITASGGTTPYTYSWIGGGTGSTKTGLVAGLYSVTVTDANGCTASANATIMQPNAITITTTQTNVSCNGGSNGSAVATVSGGVPAYTYSWVPSGATSATSSFLSAGTHTVNVTDANGCTNTASVTITQPQPVSITIGKTDASCSTACNGAAGATVTGGVAPYSYSWTNGQNGQTVNNLCVGSHNVTITDANGCTSSAPGFSINADTSNVLSVSVNKQDASCYACNNGSANANVNGGASPYSYNWSNGQTSAAISGLAAGNYCVSVTDTNGCTVTDCITINQPMQANINFIRDTNNVCAPYTVNFINQSNGVFDFYWNVRSYYLDTTINADFLSFLFETGGYYEVELCAFDSLGNNVGCAIHDVNILGFSLQFSADSVCPGNMAGFQVNENNSGGGGNGESGYTWDFGDGIISAGGDKNLHSYDSAGTYMVTVIGNHPQCGPDTISKTIVINNNVIPTVYYFKNQESSCPNDIITFYPYNASGAYTWDFGDGSPLITNELFEMDHSFADTGAYAVTVSVTNSCGNSDTYSDTVYIQNNIGFSQNQNFYYSVQPNPACPGDQVGFRYEYPNNFSSHTWNFGDGNSDTSNLLAYHAFSTAGTYFASITIVNGCGYDTTLYDTVSVQNNVPVNPGDYEFLPVPLSSCPGDSILFLAQDGAQAYLWHFGDGDSAAPYGGGGDMTGIMHAFSDTGSYYAALTVTNGCGNSLTDTFPLPVVISNNVVPSPYSLFGQAIGTIGSGIDEIQPVCIPDSFIALTGGSLFHWTFGDGSPMVTTSNVIVAHTYLYTGYYTIILIAENSCGNSDTFSIAINVGGICPSPSVTVTGNNPTCYNSNNGNALASASGGTSPYTYVWNNGKTTALNGNLLAGTYSVTVTDANGMAAIASITLVAPPPISLTMSNNAASCGIANGLASVTASGGQTPYTYLWSNGQTSQIANNLSAGQYTVTVTAANGCKAVGSTTVNAASGFAATFTGTNITCNGANNGSAMMNASGGSTPYSYNWSNGQSTATASGLAAGTYNATVTDNTGCAITGSVTVSQPPVLALNLNGTNVSSCGGNNGSVNLTVFGGVSPYTYLWSNNAATEDISNLAAGNYTVTVTDSNGCTKTKNIQITAPSSSTLSITKTNATCNGACNGSATVSVAGGSSPYTYNWSSGAVNSMATGLCAGNYSVSVVDSSGCASSASVVIIQPPALTISASATPANCGLPTGNAIANCNGGVPPYTYQWSSGDISYSADSLVAGIYLVTGTDANGCNIFVSVQVSDVGSPNITVISSDSITCYGENNGMINIAVTGTGTPFTYEWGNGAATQDISNLVAGPYEVTVTNSSGCIAVQSISISQPDKLDITVSLNNATCGNADGDATVAVNGGISPYSFSWEDGQTSATASGLQWGVYDVTVTDDNGCVINASAAVGEVGGPMVTLDSVVEANCAGTGSVYVSVADGVPPYTYSWDNSSANEDLIAVTVGNYGLIVTDANGCMGALSAQIINSGIIPDPICLITVDTVTGTNKIVWQKTFGMGIYAYKIYKESSIAGIYQLAGTIPFDSLSVFVDSVANPLIHSWRYKLAAIDSCGNESVLSGEHKTIHLTVNQGIGNTVNLIWDHYQGFSYGTYYIWRYKPVTGWVAMDSIASTLTSWTDFNPPSPYGLRYFIEIKHPDGCFATKSVENHNSSRSNKTYPMAPPAGNLTTTLSSSNEDGNCNGTAAVIVSGGVSPYSYLWNNGETGISVDSLCAGNYSCTVTDADGDTAVVNFTILLVNIAKIGDEEIRMIVYPNPNDGTFAVQCKMENQKCTGGKIIIYNMLGGIVYQSAIASHQSPGTIDLSAHGSGLYYLQLITEKGNSVPLKIVVQ